MNASFDAKASRRLADAVDVWDVYLRVIERLVDSARASPLSLLDSWAKAGWDGPTVKEQNPGAARAELERIGEECTYSFSYLRADDWTSATAFVWLDTSTVAVQVAGSDDARVEGFRAIAQRVLDQFPEAPTTESVEPLEGEILDVESITVASAPSRINKILRVGRAHATAIWLSVAGTVLGGVLLALALRGLGLASAD